MGRLRSALSRLRRRRQPEQPARRKTSPPPGHEPPTPHEGPSRSAHDAAPPKVVGPADALMTAIVVGLVVFGVVMVYSASAVYANEELGDGYHYLVRQSAFALLGLFVMVAVARVDYHRYRLLTYPALAGAVGLMLVVALGFGHSAGGAARWIQLGPINVQPSEAAKLALIMWLAYSLSKKRDRVRTFSVGFLPHALMAGLLMLLCLAQPDFGSAVMIGALTFVMLFAAGARTGYILGAFLLAAPVAWALVASSAYRMERIKSFLEPFEHRYGVGYQVAESIMSFGAGGPTGVGIGDSRQKLFFLPEAHTDFISAIIGEELGFVGVCVMLLAFALLVWRGLRASFRAADDYGSWLGVGITLFIGLQAFTNLAVALGMLPTKGLVLPFISYGGSSLLVNCAAVGILLNVSRERDAREVTESEQGAKKTQSRPRTRRPEQGRGGVRVALGKGGTS